VSLPVVGVLFLEFDSIYDATAIRALRRAAAELKVHLLCFPGNRVGGDGGYLREFNILYPLAAQVGLAGLLSFTDTLRGEASDDDMASFFRQFGDIPIVSVGGAVSGIPVVKPDNRGGMVDLVNHLIQDHGCRRIAYVGGPAGNLDADERLAAFHACHRAAGLPVDPALVLAGRFLRPDGRAAAMSLLAAGPLPEMLVAGNDAMALEAIATFQEHGVRVPEDIGVVGYDDLGSDLKNAPPLTSVRQEVGEQALCGLQLLLRRIRGEAVPAETVFPARLMRRRSCGCFDARGESPQGYNWEWPTLAEPALARLREVLGHHTGDGCTSGDFNTALAEVATGYRSSGLQLNDLRRMLLHLYTESKACDQPLERTRLLFEAQGWLADDERMQISPQFMDSIYPSWLMSVVLRRSLSGGSDYSLANVLASLRAGLRSMGVDNAYLVLYESVACVRRWDDATFPSQAQLVLGIRDGEALVAADHERFNVRSLVPVPLFRQTEGAMYTVVPLFRQNEHHGLLIVDTSRPYSVSIEQMREVVSNVVTSSIVMGELDRDRDLLSQDLQRAQSINHQLADLSETDELTGLLNRRGFQRHTAEKFFSGAKPLMLMVGDMDGLKTINDTYGHPAGDAAIVAIAAVLRQSFREGDLLARMGGDEFAVLCQHLPSDAIDIVRARLDGNIARFNATATAGWTISLSVGSVQIQTTEATNLDQIFATADALLYEDKRRRKAMLRR
jgi:diguanylate cyclase (GGDEF)-like protein